MPNGSFKLKGTVICHSNIKNPTIKIETPFVEKSLPGYLTIIEVNKLLKSISENDIFELRDKTIFELLYSCGLRISEAVELTLSDIDFENRFINVKGKGNKERIAPIGDEAIRLLKTYIKESRPVILGDRISDNLFHFNLPIIHGFFLFDKFRMERLLVEKCIIPPPFSP